MIKKNENGTTISVYISTNIKLTIMLSTDTHILICLDEHVDEITGVTKEELEYTKSNFCGIVITKRDKSLWVSSDSIVYLCGDIKDVYETFETIHEEEQFAVKELSYNNYGVETTNLGSVPLNLFNAGVYYRNLFTSDTDHFKAITDAHAFQILTESNKETNAFRTGLYISNVHDNGSGKEFNVLRCSTNFQGPTNAFKPADRFIINTVNARAKEMFYDAAPLNHVLAQTYFNFESGPKEKKAKIKAHADKTKDMPGNSLIAFTTFYDFDDFPLVTPSDDMFDLRYKKESALTRLYFRLKSDVTDESYAKSFSVKLYPNSVFLISMDTNRLYTHEIRPSPLPVKMIPTRMGYVIRSASTRAIHKNGKTYIYEGDEPVELTYGTDDEIKELKSAYFKENTTSEVMAYDPISFTMNEGDLLDPLT